MDEYTEIDFFTEKLYLNAVKQFKDTVIYGLLREKLHQTDCERNAMFTSEQQMFLRDYEDLLSEISCRQEEFVYKQGLQDSVMLLKSLGVLA